MINPYRFSDTNKRYYTVDYFFRNKFGCKVYKVPLDAGFTCPNIDGRCSYGGCTYCSGGGSGDFAADNRLSIEEQYAAGRKMMSEKWQGKCIPYFQAHTNTYAPEPVLRKLFCSALSLPDAVGLSIATRADCLEDDVVALLHEISRRTFLTVELGLQTVHDDTARRINRGHDFEAFLRGYEKLKGIDVCIHLINGLPGEDYDMMLKNATTVGALHPWGIKFHVLYIQKGTRMEKEYADGDITLPTLEEYTRIICDQLERIPEDIVIGRICGDAPQGELIAPAWSRKKLVVMNEIDKALTKRDSYQGKFV